MNNKYREQIHPEFKKIARNIPFTKGMIRTSSRALTLMLKVTPIPNGVQRRKFTVSGFQGLKVPVEVFEPEQAKGNLPCLLYIHGGGFGYKAAPYHRKLACIYAKMANCRVVFPDYHLLPDYPFPAAYEDILSVYKWICAHTEELKIKTEYIAVAGDSAGGALAANICNTAITHNCALPCFQMLIYPVTDAKMITEFMKKYKDTPLWNSINNKKMWEMYLLNATLEQKNMASPMENILPSRIPDTYVETAEIDCLHDEGIAYAMKLKAAGAKVELYETKGTIHGYDMAINSTITRNSIEKRVKALKKAFCDREI